MQPIRRRPAGLLVFHRGWQAFTHEDVFEPDFQKKEKNEKAKYFIWRTMYAKSHFILFFYYIKI